MFINSHGYRYRDDPNFAHWAAGPVIAGDRDLDGALLDAIQRQEHFGPIQQRLFDYSFDLTSEASSDRAARVIDRLVRDRAALPA